MGNNVSLVYLCFKKFYAFKNKNALCQNNAIVVILVIMKRVQKVILIQWFGIWGRN